MIPRSGPSCRLEIVDPVAFAEPASRILQEVWPKPCLRYTADYLRWQFHFPGGSRALGLMAFDGDEPVGFLAAVPRWVRLGTHRVAAHLLSFLAVRPQWRGPMTLSIMSTMVEAIQGTGMPVVTYPRPGSFSEKMVLWNFQRAGFRTHFLGSYRTYGATARLGSADGAASAEEGHEDEFLEVTANCREGRTLWSDPDREQLRHYCEDPQGRALAIIRDSSGRPIGAAIVVLAEVISSAGIESVPMIDSAFLPGPSVEILKALVRFASERWAGQATSPVVTAPNLKTIDAAVLRAAGVRLLPSEFQGYFFAPADDTLPGEIEGTNLEIV